MFLSQKPDYRYEMAYMISNATVETENSTITTYLAQCQRMTLLELLGEMNTAMVNDPYKADDGLSIALFAVLCVEIDKRFG